MTIKRLLLASRVVVFCSNAARLWEESEQVRVCIHKEGARGRDNLEKLKGLLHFRL